MTVFHCPSNQYLQLFHITSVDKVENSIICRRNRNDSIIEYGQEPSKLVDPVN